MRYGAAAIFLVISVTAGCAASRPADLGRSSLGAEQSYPSQEAAEICRLISAPTPALAEVATDRRTALQAIYTERACAPLWIAGSALSPTGNLLVERLRKIGDADPSDAAAADLAGRALSQTASPSKRAELDVLLTAAFVERAVDPAQIAMSPSAPRASVLATQAAGDPNALRAALPVDPQVRRLRSVIESYRRMESTGGWPLVPEGAPLVLGDRGARVEVLRDRLIASGDLSETAGDPALFDPGLFDPALDAGLRRFQARHGLQSDGIAARETLAALNVPVAMRRATLTVNLERLSRQQRDWGARYIVVNVAAVTLTLVEESHIAVQRRVIAGRPTWQTPQFDGLIDRLEFHPYWVVPPRIAQLELLPKIRKDPGYLKRNNMRMVDGQIRQAPGPGNPLGQVKFIFANPFSVYLHDTNQPDLFARPERFLSHGCVRVEQALDLARRLLKDDPDWPEARIGAALDAGKNVRVDLKRPISLHLVYDTAWVDDSGVVNFRKDTYGLDRLVTADGGMRPVENRCGT